MTFGQPAGLVHAALNASRSSIRAATVATPGWRWRRIAGAGAVGIAAEGIVDRVGVVVDEVATFKSLRASPW